MAGLDPEDVINVLAAEQNFGRMAQQGINTYLAERGRREEAARQERIRQAELKAAAKAQVAKAKEDLAKEERERAAKETAATTAFDRQKELEKLKADLKKKDIDPLDKKEKELRIKKLEKDLETGPDAMTEYQRERLEIAKRKEAREISEATAANVDFILSPDTNREQAKVAARTFVQDNPDADFILYEDKGAFGRSRMKYIRLPNNPRTNTPITAKDVMDTAEANNISVQELLTKWGLR